jgi:hypothetical protein
MLVVQELVAEHDGSAPPTFTVAVTWPLTPLVSTVIVEVPWPLLIVPDDTDQLKVGVIFAGPFATDAVNVIGCPASTSDGQLTEIFGHTGGGGTQPEQSATVTVALPFALRLPSLTSTVAV